MSAGNPLYSLFGIDAPTIDYAFLIEIKDNQVTISGWIDGFPAYEIYSSVNGKDYEELVQYQPPGSYLDPIGLFKGIDDKIIPRTTK
jgi:hypothetical protein